MEKNWIWAAALGVVAIIVIVIVIFVLKGGYQTPQAPLVTQVESPTPIALINSISVVGQKAGDVATVSATIRQTGYVVIHEETDGKPAKVIGNSNVLQAGSYDNLAVNLTRPSKNGENLYAMLHSDDGNGTYTEVDEDLPIKDEQGNVVVSKFTVGGAEEKKSQVTITYNGSVFSPSLTTVSSGGKVTWVNNSSRELQIASNPHPVHTDNQEVSGGQFTLDIDPGQSSTVTVTKKGTWGHHDHLNPANRGTLTVQ